MHIKHVSPSSFYPEKQITQATFLAAACVALLLFVPFYLSAQSDITARGNLAIAVKNAILSDPRSANLSQAEINSVAYALTEKATAQGITPHDLYWRPTLAHTIAAAAEAAAARDSCGSAPSWLCAFNRGLGLSGSDMIVPVLFGVLIMLVLALVAGYLELLHRNRLRVQDGSPRV